MTDIDLNFLARQNERLITEVSSLRDEVRVQGAMLLRLDNRVGGFDSRFGNLDTGNNLLLEELRAIHAQITRMNDRIRKLEDSGT
jgi:hypothetical protein